jgi:hypothetical protein
MLKGLCLALIAFLLIGLLGTVSAQVQVQTQINPQVQPQLGPFYPKPYSFRTTSPNYDPYQFNWFSGKWDYVPIPYDSTAAAPDYDYLPPPQSPPTSAGAPSSPPSAGAVPANAPPASPDQSTTEETPPDDTRLWMPPATQPTQYAAPRIVTFSGRIVAVKAVILHGQAKPHVLLRLHNDNGANGTVDVGCCLQVPIIPMGADTGVTVVGKLGEIDGSAVLFADKITIGPRTFDIDRSRAN